MNCNFTYTHYEEILQLLKDHDYTAISYQQFDPNKTHQILLRHDIDFWSDSIQDFIDIETRMGIKAVYHFMVGNPSYNINSIEFMDFINQNYSKIWMGVHLDKSNFLPLRTQINLIDRGCLDSVSFHRPDAIDMNFRCPFLHETLYSYADRFVNHTKYLTDSRMHWREGCLCGWVPNLNGQNLHVVIHPLWWFYTGRPLEDGLDQLMCDCKKHLDESLRRLIL